MAQSQPPAIIITDVGPRDGLQNQPILCSIDDRVALIESLLKAGIPQVEVGSFVSEKWVPAMVGTHEVIAALKGHDRARSTVLVPNMQGFENAVASHVPSLGVFVSASDTFSFKNVNCSRKESLDRIAPVIHQAKQQRMRVRGYISCVWGCPYEGKVPFEHCASVLSFYLMHQVDEIVLSDTIGVATPASVATVVQQVKSMVTPSQLGVHLHDTYGMAIANIYEALDHEIVRFDTAIAGLGGCPYAKGASGNVATEDVVYLMSGLGLTTGVDRDKLLEATSLVQSRLGLKVASKVGQALLSRQVRKMG